MINAIISLSIRKKTILIASDIYVMCVIDVIPDAIPGFSKYSFLSLLFRGLFFLFSSGRLNIFQIELDEW